MTLEQTLPDMCLADEGSGDPEAATRSTAIAKKTGTIASRTPKNNKSKKDWRTARGNPRGRRDIGTSRTNPAQMRGHRGQRAALVAKARESIRRRPNQGGKEDQHEKPAAPECRQKVEMGNNKGNANAQRGEA